MGDEIFQYPIAQHVKAYCAKNEKQRVDYSGSH